MVKQITIFLVLGVVFFSFGSAYGGILDNLQSKPNGVVAERNFISKEVSAQGYSPAIVVQCPYCNATNTVHSIGKSSCFNCKKYFEVAPVTASVSPPVVVTPPPSVFVTPKAKDVYNGLGFSDQ